MSPNRVELLLGWLAVVLASAVVAYTNYMSNGFVAVNIAPDTLHLFLVGFGAIMLCLAVGVTLDGLFDLLAGRVLLVLATLIFAMGTALLFDYGFFFWPSALLAIGAALLAIFRPHRITPRAW
jgi:hypothetical protein